MKLEYASVGEYAKTREMISYGQVCLFMSSSEGLGLNLEKALEEGLSRDLNIDVVERTNPTRSDITYTSIPSFTGSFKLEFPARVSPKTGFNQRVNLISGSEWISIWINKS